MRSYFKIPHCTQISSSIASQFVVPRQYVSRCWWW